jgi:multidrug efflux pump subunit AcrA (membrane-fusion protein)
VAADGVTTVLHGKVAAIGLLSSTSGSVTTFPVTVQLDPGTPALFDGSGADVRITTGTARNVVAVPNSAIHTAGRGFHSVTVVRGSSTSSVRVTLGVAGPDRTQVVSGLHVGDRVVIADYSQSVPASSTNDSTTRRGFVFGGGSAPVFRGGR